MSRQVAWFRHSSSFGDRSEAKRFILDHGYHGYGCLWRLYELIMTEGGELDLELWKLDMIAQEMELGADGLKQLITDAAAVKLLNTDVSGDVLVVTSDLITESIESYKAKVAQAREAGKKSAEKRKRLKNKAIQMGMDPDDEDLDI